MSTKSHGHHHPNGSTHNGNAVLAEPAAEHGSPSNEEERVNSIKVRAYGLWEQAGKPEGDSERERFWNEAERKVVASGTKSK